MTVLIAWYLLYLRRLTSHGSMLCCDTENGTQQQVYRPSFAKSVNSFLIDMQQSMPASYDEPDVGSSMTVGYPDLPQPGGLSEYRSVWIHLHQDHHPVFKYHSVQSPKFH